MDRYKHLPDSGDLGDGGRFRVLRSRRGVSRGQHEAELLAVGIDASTVADIMAIGDRVRAASMKSLAASVRADIAALPESDRN